MKRAALQILIIIVSLYAGAYLGTGRLNRGLNKSIRCVKAGWVYVQEQWNEGETKDGHL